MGESLYSGWVKDGSLQQGDVYAGIPFPQLYLGQFVTVVPNGVGLFDFIKSHPPEQGKCVVDYQLNWGVVVTQTCDLQPRPKKPNNPITFARVQLVSQFEALKSKNTKNQYGAMAGMLSDRAKNPTTYPLGRFSDGVNQFEGGVVSLTSLVTIPGSENKALQERGRLRLSPLALQALQERLGVSMLRTALPENDDLPEFLGYRES